jgi:hypothetical protein
MTQQQQIRAEIAKAKAWLNCCRTMRAAAKVQARSRGEPHEIIGRQRALQAAEDRCQAAYEDLKGWQQLARRFG